MTLRGFTLIISIILLTTLTSGIAAAADSATFKGENYPDWSVVDAGTSFTKTWKFENSGDEEWVGYTFNYVTGGDQLGGKSQVEITETIKPDGIVDISVDFTAPPTPTYAAKTGNWEIRDEGGNKVTGGSATIKVTINPTTGPNIPDLSKPSYNKKIYQYKEIEYNNGLNYYAYSNYGGQCTAFVWGRANEKLGIDLYDTNTKSHGRKWWYNTELPKGDKPLTNSIAVWDELLYNLFIWDNVPETDETKLKDSISTTFNNLAWVKEASVEKVDSLITVSTETNSLTLKLSEDKTTVLMEVDDGRAFILTVKEIDNKLNIFYGFGHVAYVEDVNSNDVTINQANVKNTNHYWGGGYDGEPKKTTIDGMKTLIGSKFELLGYIYLEPIDVSPEDPQELSQFKSDGITEIPIGGTINEDTVVMSGVVTDPNGKDVILEVQVEPITGEAPGGTYFDNIPNCVSDSFVKSGEIAKATCADLGEAKYHWQARTKNINGKYSEWISAGDNLETSPDFIVATLDPIANAIVVDKDAWVSTSLTGDSQATHIFNSPVGFLSATDGDTFLILSSGIAENIPGNPGDFESTDFSPGGYSGDTASVTFNFIVPTDADKLKFDFRFMSEEFPEYVGSSFNDFFYAYLTDSTGTHQISFDTNGKIINVNNNFFDPAITPAGTVFDGTTPKLTTTTDVTPGESISLKFELGDVGDGVYDTAVFLDNIRFESEGDGGTSAKADVSVTKHGPTSVEKGKQMTYTINYYNIDEAEADNIVITDTLPNKAIFVEGSAQGGTYDSATHSVSWNLDSIQKFSGGSLSLSISIPDNDPEVEIGTTLLNLVSISTTSEENDVQNNNWEWTTAVTGSSILPSNVDVEPLISNYNGVPKIDLNTPMTFTYHGDSTVSGVDINIILNDGGSDISETMSNNPGTNDWIFTKTFSPRYGFGTVTYTVTHYDGTTEIIDHNILIDPSGWVEDKFTGERIEGAIVTLKRFDTTLQQFVFVEPSDLGIDPHINPQTSDEYGGYGWFVSPGIYRVEVEKEGYYSEYSDVNIPPAVTDLAIKLEPLYVPLNSPPVANASGPYTGTEGQPIIFSGSTSYDPDTGDSIVSYEWDLDNDGVFELSGETVQNTWSDDYTGAVTLRVTDSHDSTDSTSTTVTVNNVAPSVDAGADQNVFAGDITDFTGSFTDPGADTHTIEWDFGDGNTATGTLTPTNNYANAGTYAVTLTVTDDDGGVGTDTVSTLIEALPVISNVAAASNINSAVITWETDELSDSLVMCGISSNVYPVTESNSDMITSHSVTLTGLDPDTLYYYVVGSTDSQDNSAESPEDTFWTLAVSDNEPPTIDSVLLYPAITIAGSEIEISVIASDNVGVEEVRADGNLLIYSGDGIWDGSITAASTLGSHTITIQAEDAAGNVVETTRDYTVVTPQGGVGVTILPTNPTVSSGSSADIVIQVTNTENFDDVFEVTLMHGGTYPPFLEMDLSWSDWNVQSVEVSAGSSIDIPLTIAVPTGESGLRLYTVEAASTHWMPIGANIGGITVI